LLDSCGRGGAAERRLRESGVTMRFLYYSDQQAATGVPPSTRSWLQLFVGVYTFLLLFAHAAVHLDHRNHVASLTAAKETAKKHAAMHEKRANDLHAHFQGTLEDATKLVDEERELRLTCEADAKKAAADCVTTTEEELTAARATCDKIQKSLKDESWKKSKDQLAKIKFARDELATATEARRKAEAEAAEFRATVEKLEKRVKKYKAEAAPPDEAPHETKKNDKTHEG